MAAQICTARSYTMVDYGGHGDTLSPGCAVCCTYCEQSAGPDGGLCAHHKTAAQ